jgi:hypothetical protein
MRSFLVKRLGATLAMVLALTSLSGFVFKTEASATSTSCPTTYCVLDNGILHFGSGGGSQHTSYTPYENSVNNIGLFNQPYYKSADGNWYKLTYSSYPLDMAIGSGTGGSNWTGNTVVDLSGTGGMSNQVVDYSGFVVTSTSLDGTTWSKGYGRIVVTGVFTINGSEVEVKHIYELGQTASFVKATSSVKNVSTAQTTINNIHIWVGTRDDYVGNSDQPKKRRGNLNATTGDFEVLTNATDEAKALEITTANEGALFYSTTPGTNMSFNSCCSFSNAYNQAPSTSTGRSNVIPSIESGYYDGSYAAVLPYGNLAYNATTQIVWFYAAGAIGDLAAVARAVASAAAPAVPTVTRNDQGVVVNWEAPQSSDPITNYSIRYRAVGTNDTWTVINRSPASIVRSETITGLNNFQRYEFQVAAWTTTNASPPVTAQGEWSASSIADILGAPNAPTNLTAVGGDQSAVLTFTNALTNGTDTAVVTNYEYWLGDPETWTALSPADTSSPITIPGLQNGRVYTIQLRAVNYWGPGPSATIQNVRTLPAFSDDVLNPVFDLTTAYTDSVTATDGVTYSISSGTIPTGLNFNTSTGRFSGTATADGIFTFTITATNSAGSISRTYTLGSAAALADAEKKKEVPVIPSPSFTSVPSFTGVVGSMTSISIAANRADTYEVQGLLPPGMSFDGATGVLTGSPTQEGEYQIVIIARNAGGGTAATFPFKVAPKPLPPVPSLDPILDPAALTGNPYVTVGGVISQAIVRPNNTSNGVEVVAAGWNLSVSATQSDGKAASLTNDGKLLFKEGQGIYVSGEGFKPQSEVKIYIFSMPTVVGILTTTSDGSFAGLFQIPVDLAEGPHTLQLNGISSKNELRSASLPVVYQKEPAKPVVVPAGNNGDGSKGTSAAKITQLVIPFAFNKYALGDSQRGIIKSLSISNPNNVRVIGYAQPSSKQADIAISLDRALEVKIAIQKIIKGANFTVRGSGPKSNSLCAPYRNKCVIVTISHS